MDLFIVVIVIILIIILGVILGKISSSPSKKTEVKSEVPKISPESSVEPKVEKDKKVKENFKLGEDFYIYNYLKKPIIIKSLSHMLQRNPPVPVVIATLDPQSKKSFDREEFNQYLTSGNKWAIYVKMDEPQEDILLSEYEMNVPEDTTIKMLHIGMITSRWVGASSDFNTGKPGLNAVQGLPWIKIHNFTDFPLALNNNINISPGGVLRYSGRDNFGVRLGTVFKDQDGIFPDFIFTTPATDVYYGVTSDIQQSLFGGFQLTPEFHSDSFEPQYLLENGWQGGPAQPMIPYGFIPIEGKVDFHLDRWGQPASEFNIKHPVGPPVELNRYMKEIEEAVKKEIEDRP